jgi:hypothetical protein
MLQLLMLTGGDSLPRYNRACEQFQYKFPSHSQEEPQSLLRIASQHSPRLSHHIRVYFPETEAYTFQRDHSRESTMSLDKTSDKTKLKWRMDIRSERNGHATCGNTCGLRGELVNPDNVSTFRATWYEQKRSKLSSNHVHLTVKHSRSYHIILAPSPIIENLACNYKQKRTCTSYCHLDFVLYFTNKSEQ